MVAKLVLLMTLMRPNHLAARAVTHIIVRRIVLRASRVVGLQIHLHAREGTR